MKNHKQHRKIPMWLAALALGFIGSWGLFDETAKAGPITGTPTNPATKLAVYQGLVSVYPGTGTLILEIGNLGREFISTSTLFLRPQRLTAGSALQIQRDSTTGKALVRVLGRLCLAGSCRNVWPSSSGTTFWQAVGTQITPATATHGLFSPGATTGLGDLQFYGRSPDTALYIRNTNLAANAFALEVGGGNIYGDLEVSGDINMQQNVWNGSAWVVETGKVWHRANDGMNSGLDADLLDGTEVDFDRQVTNECAVGGVPVGDWCVCGWFYLNNGSPFPNRQCLHLR